MHFEHIGQRSIEGRLPLEGPGRRLDQGRTHLHPAYATRGLAPANRAHQDIIDAELLTDFRRTLGAFPVLTSAGGRGDLQAVESGELAPDRVGHPVGEIVLIGWTLVFERQNGQTPRTPSTRLTAVFPYPGEKDTGTEQDSEPE